MRPAYLRRMGAAPYAGQSTGFRRAADEARQNSNADTPKLTTFVTGMRGVLRRASTANPAKIAAHTSNLIMRKSDDCKESSWRPWFRTVDLFFTSRGLPRVLLQKRGA